jgi:hypothetical protein
MNTIFISIASYRDNQCPITLQSIYENAENPERVYVGICQQNKDDDIVCYDKKSNSSIVNKYNSNIRIIKLHHHEAKGPTWARYLCSKLWDGEDYYFQIDSHTKLVKSWDTRLINMINKIPKQKIVISHYPPIIEEYKSDQNVKIVPRICEAFFNERDMISFKQSENIDTKDELYEVPFVAAGMFFCKSTFLKDLPFDPNLDYLFVGEEILLSTRFWTNGWDIYTPSENIAYHFYTRENEPKIWTDLNYSDINALEKVKKMLELNNNTFVDNYYGLGKIRSLKDYYEFAGIDVKNRKVVKNFCKPQNKKENINNNQYNNSSVNLFLIVFCILVLISITGFLIYLNYYKIKLF